MKVALVTGSTRGIGKGIADALLKAGYAVVYSGTSAAKPDGLLFGDNAHYIGCNVADAAQREVLLQGVLRHFGRLDVLVSNAGVAPKERRDLLEMTQQSFDEVMDVNLKGAFFLCQSAAKAMLARRESWDATLPPRIVLIGSISAYTASINRGEYCISKAGLAMVTALLADRLAPEGIPVFEVRPGIVETDMTAKVHEKYDALIADGLLPIRRFGSPQDVAGMVLAACSGKLDYTTGQVLNADGGFHLRRL